MALLIGLGQLPAQSQINGYNKMLRMRARLKDIYVNLDGLFKRTEQEIPNAIYMRIDEGVTRGTNNITVTMKLPLTGAVVPGNGRLTGTEEQPNTKAATIYRNNYKKAVVVEDYGTRNLDQVDYGLYKQHIKDLGTWSQQYEGLEIRQAYVERYGFSLRFGDTAAQCVPEWNPNIYVAGATDANQPVYDNNLATYTNNIVNSILSAGGGALTPTAAQTATFRMFNKIAINALDRKLFPLDIAGEDAYILTVSELQASIINDATYNATGGWGAQWYAINRLPEKVQNWYGILGAFKAPSGCTIYVTVDPKLPTLLPTGSAEPFSLTAGYVWPGDVDLRNRANPNTRDCSILHGKSGITNWEPEKMHFVQQDDDYYRIMGHGIAGVRGIQQVQFDQQNPNATSREYYGSMLVILARPQY